jgi:hypothetical protein
VTFFERKKEESLSYPLLPCNSHLALPWFHSYVKHKTTPTDAELSHFPSVTGLGGFLWFLLGELMGKVSFFDSTVTPWSLLVLSIGHWSGRYLKHLINVLLLPWVRLQVTNHSNWSSMIADLLCCLHYSYPLGDWYSMQASNVKFWLCYLSVSQTNLQVTGQAHRLLATIYVRSILKAAAASAFS